MSPAERIALGGLTGAPPGPFEVRQRLPLVAGLTRRLPWTPVAASAVRGVLNAYALLAFIKGRVAPAQRRVFWDATVHGQRMRLEGADYLDVALLYFPQFYDANELGYLREHIRPGDIFVDLGAHIGLYALVASRLVGEAGRVLAVEADPDTHSRLLENLAQNGAVNARALNYGVGDRRERLRLSRVRPPFGSASSFLLQSPDGVEVSCLPLLSILEEEEIGRIDGMKVDIEGYEFRVLDKFFKEAPSSLHPRFLFVEVNPNLKQQWGGDVEALLASHGYKVVMRHWINLTLEKELSA